ncbi:MAG: efflux RND transporter periplasmic adaptor subunit [bacterium]|nr:efflux RND transporter periplasmic adaptor subunit [bacterium]
MMTARDTRKFVAARATARTTKATLLAAGAVILGLAATGCEEKKAAGGFAPPPTPVETAIVGTGAVADRFATVGTLEADQHVEVTSEIDGVVKALPFPEGGHVAAGALLARLDDVQLAAEAQRAEALRDQGKATFERVRSVVDQGAGAPQDLDDATAALKVAEANLDLAQARLAKTRVTAPFAGSVGIRRVSPGAFVRAGSPLTDLTRLDRLRLTFSVPERLLGVLAVGAPVKVETTAHPGEALDGVISVIEPQLDEETRSTRVVAVLDNPELRLRPGMSATVTLVLAERAQALTVPSQAVFVTGGQSFVYVVKADSTVARAAVQLGTRLTDVVEVTGGLDSGQQVVTAGHQKLYDGARVMPVGGGAPGEPGAAGAQGGSSR